MKPFNGHGQCFPSRSIFYRLGFLSQQDGLLEMDGVLRNSNQRQLRVPEEKKDKKTKKGVKKDKKDDKKKDDKKKDDRKKPQLVPKEDQPAMKQKPDFA